MNFDVIGDIHGHADSLVALLREMGYCEEGGAWRHPGRQAVFVGDFVDRGPKQLETVTIARRMVDAGSALAVMGNHELNAIAWMHGLRPDNKKNRDQHKEFLAEVEGKPIHRELIVWFGTLPLWLELPGLNVVHACWHEPFMSELKGKLGHDRTLPQSLYQAAFREPADESSKDNSDFTEFKAVEALTKGMEVDLPAGKSFNDAGNHARNRVRVQWWKSGEVPFINGMEASQDVLAHLADIDAKHMIPAHTLQGYAPESPVIFGHYWRTGMPAVIEEGRLACIDYSVAKGGRLVAYRWDGEQRLSNKNFVSV